MTAQGAEDPCEPSEFSQWLLNHGFGQAEAMGTRAGSKPEEKARQEKPDKKKATAENQEKADAKKGELGRSSSPRPGEKLKSFLEGGLLPIRR